MLNKKTEAGQPCRTPHLSHELSSCWQTPLLTERSLSSFLLSFFFAGNTVVVVLLDEVGLAELSPANPLKVLHAELEPDDGEIEISVVGISNWALDAAKMSRCVTLYRSAPTVEDLCATAEGMVRSSNVRGRFPSFGIWSSKCRANPSSSSS